MESIPRTEYPRPQFKRDRWLCLNGTWEFEFDHGDTGLERGLLERPLAQRITVPFCPESALSGIAYTDFIEAAWYRREVRVPAEWRGSKVVLHFQAVDYDATVWVNGTEVGRHRGGFTPFTCDLSGVAEPGNDAIIVVRARDPRGEQRPGGKQSNHRYDNAACHYTRTTGIWQTVWMEPVPEVHLKRPRITPDVNAHAFRIDQPISNSRKGFLLKAVLELEGQVIARAAVDAGSDFTPRIDLPVPPEYFKFWGPGAPHLYDIELQLIAPDDSVVDRARSYAGMRGVTISGKAVKINGETVFQRQVLDQGYYPDGLMTAPSDGDLVRDIELALAAGFNSARLHQKVFEERFLYHADRLGYLVWGEFGDWGLGENRVGDPRQHQPYASTITQWLEVLERDYSHPCIVGWCPLNETVDPLGDRITSLDDVTRGLFLATKAMDGSRPVLDASGYSHRVRETDVYDSHDYEQDPARFRAHHSGLASGEPLVNKAPHSNQRISVPYTGQPYFVSEFGGIWWNPEAAPGDPSWGYGERPKTLEEFYDRFEGLCRALLDDPGMFGYCYTQLTDVFQEQNGIYRFDRSLKFDLDRIKAVQTQRAAIEQDRWETEGFANRRAATGERS